MANKLKDLVVKEISFCKQGAVPGARISVYKSVDQIEQPEESLLQKVMDRIAKTFKLEPVPDSVEVQKGIFSDAWTKKEIRNNFYDAFWTLDEVVWQIMNDENITDKVSQIQTAVREFADLIPTILPVDSTSVTKMSEVHKSIGEFVSTLNPVEKQIEGGQDDMTQEERDALVAEVAKSITESLTEVVKSVVTEQLKPVQEQAAADHEALEAIGKAIVGSKKLNAEPNVQKSEDENFWNGTL